MYLATMAFDEAFPAIEDIRIEYREHNTAGHDSRKGPSFSTKGDIFLDIGCNNRVCHEGGFRIKPIITKMYLTKQTTLHEEMVSCKGYEGSKKVGRSCWHYLILNITIKYKEAA